jgi:alkanesulfonate monooxygenase SsuD/methylene tetrahydromethanopterin reductase-like flavin-dependent oxidoreductase (luciferase family)
MTGVLVGRDEPEVRARVADLIRMFGGDDELDDWLTERRTRWIMGTPDEARERVREFEAAGVERLMLQTFLPRDLDMVRLLGEVFLA